MEDKYVGLLLAVSSSFAIGASFVLTKKGLMTTIENHGLKDQGFSYLRNPTWCTGLFMMVVGEILNFAAYAFAPAVLVTPLGALSVLVGTVLGAYFLDERLHPLGKVGCSLCLAGSLLVVLNAPADREVSSVDEILHLALHKGFLIYCALVAAFSAYMICRMVPKHGHKSPFVYVSICASTGSITTMAIKAFGIALKMTLAGRNQFTRLSTYVFIVAAVSCILTQMNYFNKALSQFSTNLITPLYYVMFTTCTLGASFLLFQGFNTTSATTVVSLLCGFSTIFSGVYLLNLSCSSTHLDSVASPREAPYTIISPHSHGQYD